MNTKKQINREVYQFDLENNLIETFKNMSDAAKGLDITLNTVRSAIERKSCVKHSFYFSYSQGFRIPKKHKNFNPMNGQGRLDNQTSHKQQDEYFRTMSKMASEGEVEDEDLD